MDNETQQNIPPIQPLPQTPITPSINFSKILFSIILGLIVIAGSVIAGSVFAGIQIGKNQITKQQLITEQPIISPTQVIVNPTIIPTTTLPTEPNPIINPTADWETYTSHLSPFSLKYPKSWPIETEIANPKCDTCVENIRFTPNPIGGGSSIAVVLVFKDPRIKTLDDYKNVIIQSDSSIVNVQNAKVDSENALSYKLSGGIPPLPIIEYVVVNNGYYFIIRLENSDETNKDLVKNRNIFNQILSTFKFTN